MTSVYFTSWLQRDVAVQETRHHELAACCLRPAWLDVADGDATTGIRRQTTREWVLHPWTCPLVKFAESANENLGDWAPWHKHESSHADSGHVRLMSCKCRGSVKSRLAMFTPTFMSYKDYLLSIRGRVQSRINPRMSCIRIAAEQNLIVPSVNTSSSSLCRL